MLFAAPLLIWFRWFRCICSSVWFVVARLGEEMCCWFDGAPFFWEMLESRFSDCLSGIGRTFWEPWLPGMESMTLFILKIWSLRVSRDTLWTLPASSGRALPSRSMATGAYLSTSS